MRLGIIIIFLLLTGYSNSENVFEGNCSYYSYSLDGKKTASGEIYNKHKLTCAHRTLPFNTKLRITYVKTGKRVTVKVNDRGPYTKGRVLDISSAAAKKIGLLQDGTGKVKCEVLK